MELRKIYKQTEEFLEQLLNISEIGDRFIELQVLVQQPNKFRKF